jgi:hypothetical protein
MGETCGTYGGEVHTGLWLEKKNLKKREHLEDPDVDVRIIL